jgi:hypothetical protein
MEIDFKDKKDLNKENNFCSNGHLLDYRTANPYGGDNIGISCDYCSKDIDVPNGFYHCPTVNC